MTTPRLNLLLVDDQAENLLALEAVLADLGHRLVRTGSGREALRCLLEEDFALILLDIQMPEMDGFETAQLIRARERSQATPIIFLTATMRTDEMMFKGYASGAVDYLIKPIVPAILRAKVQVFAELAAARKKLEIEIAERLRAAREIKKLNEDLEDHAQQIKAANKELEAFSYSVSHDLRRPLRGIAGFAQVLLQDYLPQLPSEAQRYLRLVNDSAKQMGQLIEDLLTFSRLNRQSLRKQRVDPTEIVRDALAELRADQEGRRAEIKILDLPACEADPALLKQVFLNLISNALKFTGKREQAVIEIGCKTGRPPAPSKKKQAGSKGESGPAATLVSARKETAEERAAPAAAEAGAPAAVYYVQDNGVGFDMRYADKLFGMFQRLHSEDEFAGTGVGLGIAHNIIQRHGGRVWAEAAVDQGATFFFTLETAAPETGTKGT